MCFYVGGGVVFDWSGLRVGILVRGEWGVFVWVL